MRDMAIDSCYAMTTRNLIATLQLLRDCVIPIAFKRSIGDVAYPAVDPLE